MNAPFRWRNGLGVLHAGRILEMQTVCGVTIGPLGSGWKAISHDAAIECVRCNRLMDRELPRPSFVNVDARGTRTVRA